MRHVLYLGIALIAGCVAPMDGAANGSDQGNDLGSDQTTDPTGVDVSDLTSAPGPYIATTMNFKRDISTTMMSWTEIADWYGPDCDHVAQPVPTGGNIE